MPRKLQEERGRKAFTNWLKESIEMLRCLILQIASLFLKVNI